MDTFALKYGPLHRTKAETAPDVSVSSARNEDLWLHSAGPLFWAGVMVGLASRRRSPSLQTPSHPTSGRTDGAPAKTSSVASPLQPRAMRGVAPVQHRARAEVRAEVHGTEAEATTREFAPSGEADRMGEITQWQILDFAIERFHTEAHWAGTGPRGTAGR